MSRKGRIAAYAIAVAALACVFVMYANPKFMVAVSDMIWACFGAI